MTSQPLPDHDLPAPTRPEQEPTRGSGAGPLTDRTVVIVGAGSGIGAAIARGAVREGARVVLGGRHLDAVRALAQDLGPAASTAYVDLGDEESIADLAAGHDVVDHVVTLASAPANGPVTALDRAAIAGAFDAKVVGPLLLAKHLAPLMPHDGSILLFSGIAAWKPAAGLAVMATTNGAVSFLAQALAVDLAPIRVNALSPGIIDSGAWDRLGADRSEFFSSTAASTPAGRVGTPDDVATAALQLLSSPYVTGTTLHVDGGGRLG